MTKYFILLIPLDKAMFIGEYKMRTLNNKMFDTKNDAALYLRPFVADPAPFAMDLQNGIGEIILDGISWRTFIISAELE